MTRRWLTRGALAAFAFGLALAASEVFIRVANPLGVSQFHDMIRYNTELLDIVGPPRILAHKPNHTLELFDFTIRTNALGLRGAEVPIPKPAGEYRILFLGDSVLMGWGAREGDLFVTRAERELNELAPQGRRYRCVNSGHNLFDTTQEAGVLDELGDRLEPDAVFLVYVANDVVPTLPLYEEFKKAPPPDAWTRWKGWLLGDLLRGWGGILTYCQQNWGDAERVQFEQKAQSELESGGWKASRDALAAIDAWCRKRKIPFVFLDHTRPAENGHSADIPPLAPFLESAGITRFPFHFTEAEMAQPIRHSASDPHANARGHEMLLSKLRPALASLGLATRR
jgi:hypothetical protein